MNFSHSFLSKLDILCFLNYKTSKNIYFYFKNFKLFHFLIAYNFRFFFNFFTITSYNTLSHAHHFFALNLYNMLPYFFFLIYLIILYHFFTSQKLNDLSQNENLFIYNPKVILVFLSLVFCFYFILILFLVCIVEY